MTALAFKAFYAYEVNLLVCLQKVVSYVIEEAKPLVKNSSILKEVPIKWTVKQTINPQFLKKGLMISFLDVCLEMGAFQPSVLSFSFSFNDKVLFYTSDYNLGLFG